MENKDYKIKLWMPVIKNAKTGEYLAVLSDTSIDRDDEGMSKELINSWANYTSVKALANHENKMQNWVGGWRNLSAKEKGSNYALFAEPWFFSKEANPLAYQIKKQVDEALEHGENAGISVGAIVHDSEIRKINGVDKRIFTKGELLEATWVPIQSNRNASFGHIAKGFDVNNIFNNKKPKEGNTMEKEFTKQDIDTAVEKKVEEVKTDLNKQLESEVAKSVKLEKELDEAKKEVEANKEKLVTIEKKVTETEDALDKAKKLAIEKQNFADQGGKAKQTDEEIDNAKKAFEAGKIPLGGQ